MGPLEEDVTGFDTVIETVCSDPGILFVVAFGSQTSDEATRSSDLDLAVKFAPEHSARDRFEQVCSLSGRLQREAFPAIDLTDIERLPIDVAHDAVHGEVVCGDRDAFEQFKTDIETTFDRHRDTIRRDQQCLIDRIADSGLHG